MVAPDVMPDMSEQIQQLWERAIAIEPAPGAATRAQVDELRAVIDEIRGGAGPFRHNAAIDAMEPEQRASTETNLAVVLLRAAVSAYAVGDRETGHRWLSDAAQLTHDDDMKRQLEDAMRDPERLRMLVHGRYLIARDKERAAHKLWKKVAKHKDTLGTAARDELRAPRPVRTMPTLYRMNGIGTGFYGARDHADDGSYVTTQCFSVVWVPVIPMRSFRVQHSGSGYAVLAREPLSMFARIMRWAVLASAVLAIAVAGVNSYINDPARLARLRFEVAVDAAHGHHDRDATLRGLDSALTSDDVHHVDDATAQQVGAEIVKLTAGYVPSPFTAANVDQVARVVARYESLPVRARGGAALDALLAAIDGWIAAVDRDPEAKLALLRHEHAVAKRPQIGQRLAAARLAVASAKEATDPVTALGVLVEDPQDHAAMTAAGKVLVRLADAPSLLDDVTAEVDAYLDFAGANPQIAQRVRDQRSAATQARSAAEADDVTRPQLEKLLAQQPWNQRAALALARLDADAGKLEVADARLRKLGAPAMLVRDARVLLAHIVMARGQLDAADEMVSAMLAARLPRFVAASTTLRARVKQKQDELMRRLDSGDVPSTLRSEYEAARPEDQNEVVQKWFTAQIESDAQITSLRETYNAFGDVVPMSVMEGTIKLRRAHALGGAARDAMLDAAEKAFLAVRTEAEGQPEFQLGLGEIYARLGKNAESDAAFKAVLDQHDPQLTLAIASVYRDIGRVERAKQVATDLYNSSSSPMKETAASVLGLITEGNDDESEGWYRKADPKSPSVRTALLSLEANRLLREGKLAECDRKFAEVARLHLASASAANTSGYNNASVAHQYRFECSSDPAALRDADAALEKAYRAKADDPIVVGNLAVQLHSDASVRAIAKRVDVRALRLGQGEAGMLLATLLETSERDALLADLTTDPAWRRDGDMIAQFEVLAPSNRTAYDLALQRANELRDIGAATALVERLRRAKALDTSQEAEGRKRWLAGEDDDKRRAQLTAAVARYDEALRNSKLSAKSRAVELYLKAHALRTLGVYWTGADSIAAAATAAEQAGKLWPALANGSLLAEYTIDAIGAQLDTAKWAKLRRARTAVAVLATLAASGDPLAAKIRASPQWANVATFARADTSRPSVDDLRLARLLGDPAVETRTRAVLDDKIAHIGYEMAAVTAPSDETAKEDLAYLDKR